MGFKGMMGNPGMPLSEETDTTYGGSKPGKAPTLKQPGAPDPFKLIEEQAKVNNPDRINPLGKTTFRKDPTTGTWVQNQEYSPEIQNLYEQRVGMVGEDLALSKLPSADDFSEDSSRVEKATFDRAMGLLGPTFAREENDTRSRLANQGIMEGSEAFKRDFDDFNSRRSESQNRAALDAVGAGRAEQGRLFGQALQTGQQGFQQNLGRRSQLYNELASLIGLNQIGAPNQLDVTGPFSQQYQGQVNSVNAANQAGAAANAQKTSAGATAGLAALSLFSDRRVKRDIEKVGVMSSGINLYKFKYLWDEVTHVGVMADEVEKVFPEAVLTNEHGIKLVDYARIS